MVFHDMERSNGTGGSKGTGQLEQHWSEYVIIEYDLMILTTEGLDTRLGVEAFSAKRTG